MCDLTNAKNVWFGIDPSKSSQSLHKPPSTGSHHEGNSISTSFFSFETWGLFRETFRAYFGRDNSLCIFKTKASRGTKPCSYFYFYSLYNIWKDQLYTISRSQFYKWLFGPEKSSGLSRNARLVLIPTSVLEASHSGNTQKQRNISPKIGL